MALCAKNFKHLQLFKFAAPKPRLISSVAKTATKQPLAVLSQKLDGTTGGNVVAGGFVGLGVDAMTGAMFKYPDTILLEMEAINPPTVTGEPIS
jgi:hypothetical protein